MLYIVSVLQTQQYRSALYRLCVVLLIGCSLYVKGGRVYNLCQTKENCGECQTASPECRWCSDVMFAAPRCDNASSLLTAGCEDIVLVNSTVHILQNEPVSNLVSIAPQRVRLNVVSNKGREATFIVQVKNRVLGRRSRKMTIRARHPSNLVVSINSPCPQKGGFWLSRAPWKKDVLTCPSVKPEEVVDFEVKVWIRECKPYRERMRLKVSGIVGEVLVTVDGQCSCPCEVSSLTASTEPDEVCSDNGELKCGQCECYPGYNGNQCQCAKSEYEGRCTDKNGEVCSGRGECICGSCHCEKKDTWENTFAPYSGRYCECDDYGCRTFNGQMCGGPARGRCVCGQCVCRPEYVGEACEIHQHNASCLGSHGLICNGLGTCVDGRCDCEGEWSGPTCETCQVCAARCPSLTPCVQCRVFQTGPLTQEQCASQCSVYKVYALDNIHTTKIVKKTICREQTPEGILNFLHYQRYDDVTVLVVNNEMEAL